MLERVDWILEKDLHAEFTDAIVAQAGHLVTIFTDAEAILDWMNIARMISTP